MKDFHMKKMSSLLLIALGLSMTACTGGVADNRSLNSVHQPVVSQADYALDLNVAPNGNLPAQEQYNLSRWFEAMNLGYGDRIFIVNPDGGMAARAMVEAAASRHGVKVSESVPAAATPVIPGTMRVVVTRSSARVPGCPDWSADQENNFNNATSRNFGCAVNSNLSAMVADSSDLVQGKQAGETTDMAQASKAIQSYREAEPTGSGALASSATSGDE